jgi:Family of unknown function (DUF5684)
MKAHKSVLSRMGWLLALAAILIPAATAFAQRDDYEGPSALPFFLAGGFMLFSLLIGLAFYIYMALALSTIARKTNTPNGWFAWIPILNLILVINIAKKPIWWIILCIIPLVNIVVIIILFMGVAEARNKPNWWGILMIVPLINLIVPAYLAWSD